MDLITICIGLLVFGYGIFTLITRMKYPDNSKKLKAMKEKFGNKTGTGIHVFAYTIMPLIFGILIILSGFNGLSLSEFLSN